MTQPEYYDLICTVKHPLNWAFIAEAHRCGLPNVIFSTEHFKSIEALKAAGIVDGEKLYPKWRKAIDDVSAGRAVDELSGDDQKSVVDAWYRSEF